jgi:hypothetical protein
VAGSSGDSVAPFNHYDFATIKYGPNGDTLWLRRWNGPGNYGAVPSALALDSLGSVYVAGCCYGTGGFGCSLATVKYSADGDTMWARTYGGGQDWYDSAKALALDRTGNVYVTGSSFHYIYYAEYITVKYSPSGDTQWVRRFGPDSTCSSACALAVDDSGCVYVTGTSAVDTVTRSDFVTIKYNASGDTLWVRRWNGPQRGRDSACALALDDSGNVYVTGTTFYGSSSADYATIKYNASGDSQWVQFYDGPQDDKDVAHALALDDSGNVYVTGESRISAVYGDFATVKYSPNGDTLWSRRWNGPTGGNDVAQAMALDDAGSVYVAGFSYCGSVPLENYAAVKYDAWGQQQWVALYDAPTHGFDGIRAVAVDCAGDVYVTGQSGGVGSSADYATIKYVQSGGAAEGFLGGCRRQEARPTIVRGVLCLPPSSVSNHPSAMLDIAGRKVMELRAGNNDVSHLAPGVYFARQAAGIDRVIIAR